MNKSTFTDAELEELQLKTEVAIIAYSRVEITKSFVYCNIQGASFRVRVYECGSKNNETIVLSCGLMFPQLHWMYLWERLAENYRVVVFEHGSCGLNTKLNDCPGLQSSDAAEEWVIAYWTEVISKLDLPEKFHLFGLCHTGMQVSLYASTQPERVLSLFLVSPMGCAPFEQYQNPFVFKMPDSLKHRGNTTKQELEMRGEYLQKRTHLFHKYTGKPYSAWLTVATEAVTRNNEGLDIPYQKHLIELFAQQYMKYSVLMIVELQLYSVFGFAFHPLQGEDRLGSDKIDFPIAYVFGDDDWNGSEGADEIVRNNKHYRTGRSQIWTVKDSDHQVSSRQTDELMKRVFGFLEGSLTGHFELKPRERLSDEEISTNVLGDLKERWVAKL